MASAKQPSQSQSSPEAVNPLAPTTAPVVSEVESQEKVEAATVEDAIPVPAKRTPGMKRFRLEKSSGESEVIEAATVEDAIRELNSGPRSKIFTFKSLKVTEVK